MDITHDSVVICLTGVPHYITDSTITMLVSTFGIAIGEVERRFYKGVDTGERYVRLKPRAHTQVPDFVTVGGCKILIRVLSNEEVCPPYTLQSQVRINYFRRTSTVTSFVQDLGKFFMASITKPIYEDKHELWGSPQIQTPPSGKGGWGTGVIAGTVIPPLKQT